MNAQQNSPRHNADSRTALRMIEAAPDAGADHWREIVTQLGSEIAGPLTLALERVHTLATTGCIDRQSLRALREELDSVRQAGINAQQLGRFGSGRLRQAPERMHLTQTVQGVLTHRTREAQARGLKFEHLLQPVEVIADASMLFGLLSTLFDWAMDNARSTIEWRVETQPFPAHARLTCRFEFRPASATPTVADHDVSPTLDSLAWRLIEQIAQSMSLPLERSRPASGCLIAIDFPRTVRRDVAGVTAIEIDDGFAPSTNSKPLAGSQVLVVAARRDVRHEVLNAIRHMGLIVDFVHSVSEAAEFCREGLPHAVIYEASLAGDRFKEMRAGILGEVPTLAFIEIAEEGNAFEVSGYGGQQQARVGREAIAASLPSSLMFELSKAL